MKATVEIKDNIPKLTRTISKYPNKIVRAEVLINIPRDLKGMLVTPKRGRVYERPWGWHRASAPGEAPAHDYGTLIASIVGKMIKTGKGNTVSTDPKAPKLELGTPTVKARPFFGPAADKASARVDKAIALYNNAISKLGVK